MINGVSSQAIGSSITFFPFGMQSIFIIWFICQWARFLQTMKRHLCTLYCWEVIISHQGQGWDRKDSPVLISIFFLVDLGNSCGVGCWQFYCFPFHSLLTYFSAPQINDYLQVEMCKQSSAAIRLNHLLTSTYITWVPMKMGYWHRPYSPFILVIYLVINECLLLK